MKQDRKNIIKKLFQDKLTQEEQSELFFSSSVTRQMQKQWDDSMENDESISGEKIWNNIQKNTSGKQKSYSRYSYFYKTYSLVASFLLILAVGGVLYYYPTVSDNTIYTISTGVRSIDSIVLPDGSKVELGPNSKLVYPENFGKNSREIKLTGQAFFYVAKDKEHPFIVHSPKMDVAALGTAFEVFNYENVEKTEAILLNGKVEISLNGTDLKPVILTPNQKLTYNRKTSNVTIEEVNANQYTQWRDKGVLSFENEKLTMIIPRLEQWYNEKIVYPEEIEQYRFTFKVKDESLERILYMISNSSQIKYRKAEDKCELYLK